MWQFSAYTFWHPPEISEPITTPPCPSSILQLRIMMFLLGVFHRRPSLLRPLFMAIQSSPVWKVQFCISTFSHASGSHPSPLGPSFQMYTPSTVMFFDSNGWITQKGELVIFTSFMRIPSQRLKLMSCGLSPCPIPNLRSSSGTPSSAYFSSCALLPSFCDSLVSPSTYPNFVAPHHGHHVSRLPLPSMVPLPVMATSVSS